MSFCQQLEIWNESCQLLIIEVKRVPLEGVYFIPRSENWTYINRSLLESLNLLFLLLRAVPFFDTRLATESDYS